MTHKEEVKLNRFLAKCDAMRDIALCMLGDKGHWEDGTGKKKLVYQVDKAEISDTTVVLSERYNHKFNIKIGGEWKKPMELTDDDLEELIEARLNIVKAKKAKEEVKKAKSEKKVKRSEKKAEKKKAEPAKDYTNTTYLDVFKRVVGIMNDKTGYAPNDEEIEDEENGVVDICLDFDGWEHRVWQNARTFLGGWTEEDDDDYETESIFELVADLDMKYEKLASRWDAQFCSSCRILGQVDVKDSSPAGIMKALDEAGL